MNKIGKYFLGVFFFGAFLAGGLYCGYAVFTQLPLAISDENWPTTEGVIVKSDIRRCKSKSPRHALVYSYQVDGQYFDGRRVTFMDKVFRATPESMAQKYPKGQSVTVYYSQNDPAISVLETAVWWLGFITAIIAALVFTVFGLLGVSATFR